MTEVLPDVASSREIAQDPYAELYYGMRELLVGGLATAGVGIHGPEARVYKPFLIHEYTHPRKAYGRLVLAQLMIPAPQNTRFSGITADGMRGTMIYRAETPDLIGASVAYYSDSARYRGSLGQQALGIFTRDMEATSEPEPIPTAALQVEPFSLSINAMNRRLQEYRATTGY